MSRLLHALVSGVAFAGILAAHPAIAETVDFMAELKASNEVPPVNSSGTGTLTATYDTSSKTLSWRGNVSGLTGNVTAAHFHGPAEPGQNAGVLVPAPGVSAGSFEGSATLTDEQSAHLMAGRTYFNIHTAANPGGEVRGQVVRAQ